MRQLLPLLLLTACAAPELVPPPSPVAMAEYPSLSFPMTTELRPGGRRVILAAGSRLIADRRWPDGSAAYCGQAYVIDGTYFTCFGLEGDCLVLHNWRQMIGPACPRPGTMRRETYRPA